MTDQPTAEDHRAKAHAMSEDLSAYINDLDAPTLMAELRCLAGSLGNTLGELDGAGQMAIAFRALCVGPTTVVRGQPAPRRDGVVRPPA